MVKIDKAYFCLDMCERVMCWDCGFSFFIEPMNCPVCMGFYEWMD